MYIRETIAILDTLEITSEDRDKIYCRNAERLFRRTF
jgi:predicted TIM-barrel fold metal-dependent hydrolase